MNKPQRAPNTEEVLNNHVAKMTQPVNIRQLLLLSISKLTKWCINRVAEVVKIKAVHMP